MYVNFWIDLLAAFLITLQWITNYMDFVINKLIIAYEGGMSSENVCNI